MTGEGDQHPVRVGARPTRVGRCPYSVPVNDSPTEARPPGRVIAGRTWHPSGLLLGVQLLLVLAYPFLEQSRAGAAGLGVLSVIAVGIALWVVRSTPALTVLAVALGMPAVVMSMLEAVLPGQDWVFLTSSALHAPFYFYVAYSTIRYLFHDDQVTTDELYAIGAAFTVVAWGFAYVYVAVEIIWPGSITPLHHGGATRFYELLFFSFTNLTSVGLSDILPVAGHARSVVVLEQVGGVLYVAMVISRLVAMTVRNR
jgi:hypothetical protein